MLDAASDDDDDGEDEEPAAPSELVDVIVASVVAVYVDSGPPGFTLVLLLLLLLLPITTAVVVEAAPATLVDAELPLDEGIGTTAVTLGVEDAPLEMGIGTKMVRLEELRVELGVGEEMGRVLLMTVMSDEVPGPTEESATFVADVEVAAVLALVKREAGYDVVRAVGKVCKALDRTVRALVVESMATGMIGTITATEVVEDSAP